MSILGKLEKLGRMNVEERSYALRFRARQSLAQLPYFPIRVRLPRPDGDELRFWWSYVPPFFNSEIGFLDYWGKDIADLQFVARFLQAGMTFFDVGAYHGIYTIVAAHTVGNWGRVVAFEPSARERRRLRLHVRMNRATCVAVEKPAVGSSNNPVRFFIVTDGDTAMNSSHAPELATGYEETVVSGIRLDDFCRGQGIASLDLIKIDAEGSELAIFAGAEKVLGKLRPLLICEVLDLVTEPHGYPAREIVGRLSHLGYEWYEFSAGGTLLPHKPQEEYREVRNYLAVPKEKVSAVERFVG